MPVRGKGTFPKPAPVFREGTDDARARHDGLHRPVIAEYRALKKLASSDEALKLLRRVGLAVRPIMLKHGWHLPLLVEMYPKSHALLGLNVNRGQKIALRLRRPFNETDFIDEESITETMLHELAHNLRGPHDDVFFRHLDTLTQEWFDLRAHQRLPGQGFMSAGQMLGGPARAVLNPVQVRAVAGGPAERRKQHAGRTTGTLSMDGPSIEQILTPREAAVLAAERRRQIAAGCPSNHAGSSQRAAEEQEQEERTHGLEIITIDDDEDDDHEVEVIEPSRPSPSVRSNPRVPCDANEDDDDEIIVVDVKTRSSSSSAPQSKRQRVSSTTVSRTSRSLTRQTQDAAALRYVLQSAPDETEWIPNLASQNSTSDLDTRSRHWTCQTCTLINPSHTITCTACRAARPGLPSWTCRSCHHRMLGAFADFWCCSECGTVKVA